jgi:alpha-tubulin suppressor-like RCC1 family protein
LLKN